MQTDDSEFDDIVRTNAPYITSAKAVSAMRSLAGQYSLGFLFNPGGGQFVCRDSASPVYGLNCQISTYDDIADLEKLRTAIANALPKHPA